LTELLPAINVNFGKWKLLVTHSFAIPPCVRNVKQCGRFRGTNMPDTSCAWRAMPAQRRGNADDCSAERVLTPSIPLRATSGTLEILRGRCVKPGRPRIFRTTHDCRPHKSPLKLWLL
jgi:hypothetical protein